MSDDQFSEFKDYLDLKLDPIYVRMDSLEQHMDSGFATLAESIDRINDTLDLHDKKHKATDRRLRKLEKIVL